MSSPTEDNRPIGSTTEGESAKSDCETEDFSHYSLIDPNLPPEIRAQLLVEQVVRRRREGEVISDEQLLARHPELLGTLEKQLRKAAVVQIARSTAVQEENSLESLLERLDADPELSDSKDVPEPPSLPSRLAERLAAERKSAKQKSQVDKLPVAPPAEPPNEVADGAEFGQQVQASVDNGRITIDEIFNETDEEDRVASVGEQDLLTRKVDGFPEADAPSGKTLTEAESHLSLNRSGTSEEHPDAANRQQTKRYRPAARAPTALLRMYDDDQVGGELFRIRKPRIAIGRSRGDILVPHDSLMSGEHAAVERNETEASGKWEWTLRDLNSTNGIYVKARKIRLRIGDQLLIAGQAVQLLPGEANDPPYLQQARPDGSGDRLILSGSQYWLGRDREVCTAFMSDQPMLDAQFARLLKRADGRWTIWSGRSLNGLWIRVDKVKLADGSAFQLGEQRFSFHLP